MITEHIQFSFSVSCQLLGDLYATRTRWRWDALLSELLNYLIDQPEQAYNSYGRKKSVQQSRQQGFAWLQQAAFRQADNFSYHLGCYDKTESRKSPLGRNFRRVSGQSKAGAANAQGDTRIFSRGFKLWCQCRSSPEEAESCDPGTQGRCSVCCLDYEQILYAISCNLITKRF